MKAFKSTSAEPPSPIASQHIFISFPLLSLIPFVTSLSKSINSHTNFTISLFFIKTSPFTFSLTLNPTFQSSTIILLLNGWSNPIGKVNNGTPEITLSLVEFQPQCDQNPPIEECDNTLNWSHHSKTSPMFPQICFNLEASLRAIHKNRTLLSRKAFAISSICSLEADKKLPCDM
ncbi:hypothetical protein KIW84_021768 [Lathyrus oleraceus]|uniref:Uncharacterized protein n=1 Tax=Pisum sativum TaxID=3888 RepID=A0A9D4Y9F7_PEA|nr:hypothetical protein KIW84_021768 [Pisum sativum]